MGKKYKTINLKKQTYDRLYKLLLTGEKWDAALNRILDLREGKISG